MAVKKESAAIENTETIAVKKTSRKHKTLEDFRGEIMERAFELYLKRVNSENMGDEIDDWVQAEAEIRKKHDL